MPNREASGPTPLQGPGATRLEAVERLRRQLADLESGAARPRPDSPRRIRPAAKRAKSEGDSRGVWRSDGGPIDHEASDPSYQGDAGFSGAEAAEWNATEPLNSDEGQRSPAARGRRSGEGYREDGRDRPDSAATDFGFDSGWDGDEGSFGPSGRRSGDGCREDGRGRMGSAATDFGFDSGWDGDEGSFGPRGRRSGDGRGGGDRNRTDSGDHADDSFMDRPVGPESGEGGSGHRRRRGNGYGDVAASGAEDGERAEGSGRRGRRRARRGADGEPGPGGGGTEAQAKDVCLRLLTDRARSRAELANKLADKGFRADVAERVLNRLAEVGLIDDAAFAEQWVHSRHTYSGRGKKALAQELRRKGVAPADAEPALAAITSDDEHTRATELVHRKLQSLPSDLDRDKAIRRLVGMLARRGYDPSTAHAVVMAAVEEAGLESERRPPPSPKPNSAPDESAAAELVRRKLRTMPSDLDREKTIRRLVGMLARRGYPQSAAYSLVKAELAQAD